MKDLYVGFDRSKGDDLARFVIVERMENGDLIVRDGGFPSEANLMKYGPAMVEAFNKTQDSGMDLVRLEQDVVNRHDQTQPTYSHFVPHELEYHPRKWGPASDRLRTALAAGMIGLSPETGEIVLPEDKSPAYGGARKDRGECRRAPEIVPGRLKLGRNEPCHCGSGKKFKKCCYEKEVK